MYRSFLSWRYLVSRPTNLIGIVGILVAVGALILILSIMTGFLEESRKTLRGTLSDLIIQPRVEPSLSADGAPASPGPLLAAVRADPRVAGATPQLVWIGTLVQAGHGYESILSSPTFGDLLGVQLVGIDVDGAARGRTWMARLAVGALGGVAPRLSFQDELDATAFLNSIAGEPEEEGETWTIAPVNPLFPFAPPPGYQPRGRPKAAILVGEQLYSQLGLDVGDEVQIGTMVPDPRSEDVEINNREFVVAGTFRTRENETDQGRIYLDRRELADFIGNTLLYSQVLVSLVDYERDSTELASDLRESLSGKGLIAGGPLSGEVRTWEQFRGGLLGAIENERVLMGIMLSLVLVVAGFTIFAILSMMVTEKRRDVGILCALGAPPRGILQLFLMIAFWDALVGGLLGALIGVLGALKIDPIERWLSDTFGIQIFNRDVYLFDHIPSIVQPLGVALIVLGAFACALVFAALPAWRAARLDPLEALRYE